MLGSYSRCATRPFSVSPSLSISPWFVRSGRPVSFAFHYRSFSFRFSARLYNDISVVRPVIGGRRRRRRWKKKEEDLGQFLSHKPADRAAPIKNASLRMAIGPQRGSGGNAEPRALFLPTRCPSVNPCSTGVSVSSFALCSFGSSFSTVSLLRLCCTRATPCPVIPRSSFHLRPSRSLLPRFFFRRGEKMRAARRLVEGTDDVVSDVPPPGTFGGGDARETMVRGRAVECELRHRRGVHISRGCRCWMPGVGLRSNWMEILLHWRSLRET